MTILQSKKKYQMTLQSEMYQEVLQFIKKVSSATHILKKKKDQMIL